MIEAFKVHANKFVQRRPTMERCTCSWRWSVRMPLRRGAGDHRVGGGAGPPTTLSGPRSVAVRTHRGTGTSEPYPLPGSASTGGEHAHASSDAAAANSRGYPGLGLSGTNAGTPGGELPEDTPAWATAVPMRALPEELPEDTPAGATSVPMRALPEERDEPMLDAPVAPVDSARHSTGDPCRLMLHQGLRT